MSHLEDLPVWAAALIAFFLLLGSGLTLLGALGLVRLSSFYDRLHAPTLGTSWGTAGIVVASILLFSLTGERVAMHEILIGVFVMITTPVTLLLLGRAALHRERADTDPTLTTPPDEPGEAPAPNPRD